MSIKKEPSGRRSVQVEVEVPGTPEEVWRAIATGPGISAWFVPTTSEERAGGEVVSNFGPGMDCPATITEWEAPKRFVAEGVMGGPGSPKVATEWTVEARAGGRCVVRVVHSLFASTDDWDNQLDGLEQGWPTYFRILRMYLERYKDQPCSAMQFVGFSTEAEAKAWEKAGGALGLLKLCEGQQWSAPEGVPHMAGEVDALGKGIHANTILLRLDAPAPGTAYVGAFSCGGMVMVCLSIYLYGDKAKAAVEQAEPTWQKWIGEQFPMPQME
ncbi:MAG TPA: SRPBCC domain-containing protein [Phycisphaerae bacterium]|nr:SRPBCC domain-containing protein [Phycisphaerae bacterium]